MWRCRCCSSSFLDQVVDISVVVQRQFPMVLFRIIEILQLQYTDKVIDVPVVQVQFPSAGVEKTAELPHCSRRALESYDSIWDIVKPVAGNTSSIISSIMNSLGVFAC